MICTRWKCLHLTVLILSLSLCCVAVSAADTRAPTLPGMIPSDNISLANVAALGTGVPLSALEPQEEITLLDLESNQTSFPGPRDMAFGPRSIRVTSNPPTLIILVMVAGLAVLTVVLYRKKKAAVDRVEPAEDTTKPAK